MKILGLLRHAKSEWDDLAKRDFDRGLNERGRLGGVLIGDHIRSHGVKWDRLVASPAARVKETLQCALPEITPVYEDKLYLASPDTLVEAAQAHCVLDDGNEADTILLSGHNPGLQEVLFDLVSPSHENDLFKEASVKFPTATFAVLECDVERWADVKNHCAKLVHFARPRDLDPDLGPEF